MSDAAAAVRERLARDPAARHAGIEVVEVSAERVELALTAADWMVNGHGIVHGAMLFWLGDTAFAFVSDARGVPSVTRQADIVFIAPVPAGARLRAVAIEKTRFGRNSIVDVDLLDDDDRLVGRMTLHGVAVRT